MNHSVAKFHANEIADRMAAAFWMEHVEIYGSGGGGEADTAVRAKKHLEDAARQSFAKLAEAMGYTITANAQEAA